MEKISAKSILLVDDHQEFLTALANIFMESSRNVCIRTAENGVKALKVLESAQVDLVMTDLKMPVMDGFDFLSQMRKMYPDIPVIVVSAFIDSEVEKKLRSMSVTRCIEKLKIEKFVPVILRGLD